MANVGKKMIAISFARPKMQSVFSLFLGFIFVKVELKMQYNDLSYFELITFSREENFILRDESQNPLIVFWQLFVDANPIQFVRSSEL